MGKKYQNVMTPIRIGNHLIKNRIIAAPVTLHSASNGETYPTDYAMDFFTQRARDGSGIVVCAGAKLLPVTDDGEHASWDLYKHNSMNKMAELAESIHFYGAKASMELIGIFDEGYAASDGGLLMDGVTPGREIPISEMMRYKEGYAHCAEALMNLGFDGMLLHFGHSIPVAQFLSPLTNKRTDQYGGSFENRMRYIVEILEAIRERVGKKMFIDIRMSADEFAEGGIDIEEGIKIAKVFEKYADIIQASCGRITPELMCRTHPCDFLPPNPNVYLAEAFKKRGVSEATVCAIGGIGSLEDANEIIGSGKADFVAISRALIADINMISKSVNGNESEIMPCIKCMRCHDSTVYGNFFQCSVNPTIGIQHKIEDMISAPQKIKKVAVIGGGPAGMKAALTAADRGHEVTLFEKTNALGGALKFASKVSFKYSLAKYKDFLVDKTLRSSVSVKFNTEAKPSDLKRAGYDAVIVAIGAEPLVPKISGVEHTILATDAYSVASSLGAHIIVIGGGQVGCETALHLARLGKQVTVLEMRPELAPDASITHRGDLMAEIKNESNLTAITFAQCTEVSAKGVSYVTQDALKFLKADHVILAAGMLPKVQEADQFIGLSPTFVAIGDCVRARTVEMATREGYFAGITL